MRDMHVRLQRSLMHMLASLRYMHEQSHQQVSNVVVDNPTQAACICVACFEIAQQALHFTKANLQMHVWGLDVQIQFVTQARIAFSRSTRLAS